MISNPRLCHLALLALAAFMVGACASSPDPTPEEFIDFSTSALLGKSRSRIERDMKPRTPSDGDGWVRYTRTFSVEFEGDKAVAIKERAPKGMGCLEAAQWLGFERARAPILKTKTRCVWPTDSPEHGLGKKNLSGTMAIDTRIIEIKLH